MWFSRRKNTADQISARAKLRQAHSKKVEAREVRHLLMQLAIIADHMETILISQSEHTGYAGSDLELAHTKLITEAKLRGFL